LDGRVEGRVEGRVDDGFAKKMMANTLYAASYDRRSTIIAIP